jgi:hypothetical protein
MKWRRKIIKDKLKAEKGRGERENKKGIMGKKKKKKKKKV